MSNAILLFLLALLLTIIVEIGVGFLFRFKGKDEIKVIIWMNVFTNPIMNAIILIFAFFISFHDNQYIILLSILEPIIIAVEYLLLSYVFKSAYSKKKLLLMTISMNTASYVIGYFIMGSIFN